MGDFNTISFDQSRENAQRKFLSATYGWMALALLISAAASFLTATLIGMTLTGNAQHDSAVLSGYSMTILILAIGEIGLVWWLSASIRNISVKAAVIGYTVYSILNGVTLSSIFFVYQLGSIGTIFISCAGMFGVMALYGLKTKSDLRKAGKYLMMALIGIIIASVVNSLITLFTRNPVGPLDWLISIATVVVFAGLTAYDSQKLLSISGSADGSDAYKKISIIGALELYMDFINMFLALLRLFGRRRD